MAQARHYYEPPRMMESTSYTHSQPLEVCAYWKYRHMTRCSFSPAIGEYDCGVLLAGSRHCLRVARKASDLVTFIKLNVGKRNYSTCYCIFCGGDGAPSLIGEEWSYHVQCSIISANEGLQQKVPPISRVFDKELKFGANVNKELMFEFIQMRQMTSFFDEATNDKYCQKRKEAGIVDLSKWKYEDSHFHVSFRDDQVKCHSNQPSHK